MQKYKKKSYFCKIKTNLSEYCMKYSLPIALLLLLAATVTAQRDLSPAVVQGEQKIEHKAYILSFNSAFGQPSWVYYLLTSQHAEGSLKRKDSFKADPMVDKASRVTPADYRNSGYDKGHLAPNADMNWDGEVQKECFYMSNMSPQTHAFNAGLWKSLEELVRQWAMEYDSLYIVTGPVFDTLTDTIGNTHRVGVPRSFYKVVLDLRRGVGIGFLVSQDEKRNGRPLSHWAVSIDEVERRTGLDFYPQLPDRDESRIEAEMQVNCWLFTHK